MPKYNTRHQLSPLISCASFDVVTSGGSDPVFGDVLLSLGWSQNDCGSALSFIGRGSVNGRTGQLWSKQVTG